MKAENLEVVTGCLRISPGCDSCPSYHTYKKEGRDYSPVFHHEVLKEPYLNKEPTLYYIAFGSDLLHESITDEQIASVFKMMNECNWHRFNMGTKRIERMSYLAHKFLWTHNIIAGTHIESHEYMWRLNLLKTIPALTRQLAFAPLLGPVGPIDLMGIDEVHIAFEDYGLKRLPAREWVENIQNQCVAQATPCSIDQFLWDDKKEIANEVY